jgi:hypothetical protein
VITVKMDKAAAAAAAAAAVMRDHVTSVRYVQIITLM